MSNTKKIKVLNITFYNFLSRILFYAFVFLSGVYASRILTTGMFGTLQYINFTITVLWTFFNFGGAATLQRFFAHAFKSQNSADLQRITRFAFALTTFSIFISTTAWLFYGNYSGRPIQLHLIIYLMSQFLSNFTQVMAQSTFRFKEVAVGNSMISILGFGLLYYMLPAYGIDGYFYAFTAVQLANSCWSLWVWYSAVSAIKSAENTVSSLSYKTVFRTAAALSLSGVLAAVLWQRTEIYFIKQYIGYDQLAVYGVALSVLALTIELFRILPGAMMPYFSAHKDETGVTATVYYVFMRYFSWLIVFVCLFVAVHASSIVQLLYTEKYANSSVILPILLMGYAFGAMSFLTMQLHIGLGQNRFLLIQDFTAAVLVLIGCALFIPVYGILAAAWVKSIAVMLAALMGIFYHRYKLGIYFPWRYLVLSVLLASITLLAFRYVTNDSLLKLVVKFMLTFSLYFAMSLVVGVVEKKRFFAIYAKIKNRVV